MNLFYKLLESLIIILFPLFIYLIFVLTSKKINKRVKNLIFDMLLISDLYLLCYYNSSYFNLFLINTIIIIAYIKNRVLVANTIAIISLIYYINNLSIILFMLISYLIIYCLYKYKIKKQINDFLFIDLYLITYYIFSFAIYKYFKIEFLNFIVIILFNYIIVHLGYLIYMIGNNMIDEKLSYNKIRNDAKMQMSLFKITHEIKNPIAVIKAYLDMLDTNNKEQIDKYIPIIKEEIKRLLNLLQDFLLVNKVNISFDIMDINMLLEDIIDKQLIALKENNINVEEDIVDDEVYINGDYNRLSQVVINIIKNSIEAMNKDKNNKIKIKSKLDNNDILVIVEDNGMGISSSNLEKIKEPFYTTKSKGTGLGVSLSEEIIKAHHGDLEYESKENVGTKVTIRLPIYKKEDYA